MRKDLFDWFFTKKQTFTLDEVKSLVDNIKVFNAGAIDDYLTRHVDAVFEEWMETKKGMTND